MTSSRLAQYAAGLRRQVFGRIVTMTTDESFSRGDPVYVDIVGRAHGFGLDNAWIGTATRMKKRDKVEVCIGMGKENTTKAKS